MKHTHVRSHIKRSHGKKIRVRGHSRVLTKSALIHNIVEKNKDYKAKDVNTILGATTDEIKTSLHKGQDVRLNGLGTFKVKNRPARPARKGINPLTGVAMTFKAKPAHKVVRFRPAKEIKP